MNTFLHIPIRVTFQVMGVVFDLRCKGPSVGKIEDVSRRFIVVMTCKTATHTQLHTQDTICQ